MNYEILTIDPVLQEDVTVRLGFTLKVTDPETNDANTGETFVEFPEGVNPATDAEREQLVLASREYASLVARLASPLLMAKTMRVKPAAPEVPTLTEEQIRAGWMRQIDVNIANIITKRTQFQMGYEQREAAAKAYKEAGYEGDPTIWITAFADEAGFSYKDATDIILGQAAQLRKALEDLEALRMGKYRVLRAETRDDAQQAFLSIINAARDIDEALK